MCVCVCDRGSMCLVSPVCSVTKGAILIFFPLLTTVKQYRPPSLVRSPVQCVSPCPQIACSFCQCVTVPTETVPTDCQAVHSISVSPCPQIARLFIQSVYHRAHRLPGCSFNQCVTVPTDCQAVHSISVSPCPQIARLFIQSVYHRDGRSPVHSVSVSPCPQIACSFNQCITVPTDCQAVHSISVSP